MFTGIIQEVGKVKSLRRQGSNLIIETESRNMAPRLEIGASVSINGACQTVVERGQGSFKLEAVAETLSRTNLGQLRAGSAVNIETPLTLNDMLHGHLVQGHVDCVTRISDITSLDGSAIFGFGYPRDYGAFIIEKGSIAVDGVSLTVVAVSESSFQVSIIPHTMENTIFKWRRVGDLVNLEFDMIARYIQKMISSDQEPDESRIGGNKLTMEFLKEHGY
jgi:riboflavin synthase